MELFGGLFSNGEVRPYIHSVAHLQDLLEAHNDAMSIERVLHDIEGNKRVYSAKVSGIVLDWHGQGAAFAEADLRKSWEDIQANETFLALNRRSASKLWISARMRGVEKGGTFII